MNYNSKLTAITHTLTGHELQFEMNSNSSQTHGTRTIFPDKKQPLTHSRDMNYNSRLTTITHTLTDMNYNSRLTAITHTLTRNELQFEINSNHSLTHGT